ncbi:MAG: radical SAM protein [Candidatus Woesearchaeota archaeon]
MDDKLQELIFKANKVYNENFNNETYFGRCIFLSWYCDKGSCDFCFRSTIKHKIKHSKNAKRSVASILTDAYLGKKLGFKIEFLTGGYGIFEFDEIVDITKKVSEIYNEKIWINLGVLSKEEMIKLKPYIKGICASIETIEEELHNKICPEKPIKPYEEMLDIANSLKLKKSITIVIGLNEKKEDINLLFDFIKKHKLDQITFYALKPIKETPYTKSPSIEYYSWWIANTRINFPKLKIIAGLTPKTPEYTKIILKAGANAITKFPVLKKFNTKDTKLIEDQIKEANRNMTSNLTKLPKFDIDKDLEKFDFNTELKKNMKEKIMQYINKFEK